MEQKWKRVIEAEDSLWKIPFGEIWEYRDLCLMYIKKNLTLKYKQTILGPLYILINPLLSSGIFWLVFSYILGISTSEAPELLFFMSGSIMWGLLAGCVTDNSYVLADNAYVMGKVYFPRLVVPIANSVTKIINMLFQLLLFAGIYVIYALSVSGIKPSRFILLSPVFMLAIVFIGTGIGLLVSALTTKYKDLGIALGLFLQLWMYMSPVVYSLTSVPQNIRWLVLLNPVSSLIESVRFGFFGTGYVNVGNIIYALCFAVVSLFVGILAFNRVEKKFIDTI